MHGVITVNLIFLLSFLVFPNVFYINMLLYKKNEDDPNKENAPFYYVLSFLFRPSWRPGRPHSTRLGRVLDEVGPGPTWGGPLLGPAPPWVGTAAEHMHTRQGSGHFEPAWAIILPQWKFKWVRMLVLISSYTVIYTKWAKSRFTVINIHKFILVLLFVNNYIIFHVSHCKPTFAHPCDSHTQHISLNFWVPLSDHYLLFCRHNFQKCLPRIPGKWPRAILIRQCWASYLRMEGFSLTGSQ